jgi:N-acetylglucosamine malate deacetylase 1
MANVLAVTPHPDDIEMGCLGTLLKHKEAGDDVTVVVATKGGYGDRPWSVIHSEMLEAQKVLDTEYVVFDNPVGHYKSEWKTVSELDAIIRDRKIDIIYTSWYGDSHQDHQATFRNVLAAARTKNVRSLYCYEISDYSYRSQNTFNARRYVDITPYMEKKLAAMRSYKTYIKQYHLDVARALAAHRGLACGTSSNYAEAFEVIFETWIDIISTVK